MIRYLTLVLAAAIPYSAIGATTSLHGSVFASDNGQPLVNVQVDVYSGCYTDPTTPCLYFSTRTDAAGRFSGSVEVGGVTVSLNSDYLDDYLPVSDNFTVTEGQPVSVAYYMELGGSASGTVRRADNNQPLQNVFVQFTDLNTAWSIGTDTDANGYYELHKIRTGTFGANAQISDNRNLQTQWYANRSQTPPSQGAQIVDAITVGAGQRRSSIDFTLAPGAILRGIAINSYSGLPLRDTPLAFAFQDPQYPSTSWFSSYATTADDGSFEVASLPGLPVYLSVYGSAAPFSPYTYPCGSCASSNPAILSLSASSPTNIDISLFPSSVIAGTVTDKQSGEPIEGALVSLTYFGTYVPPPLTTMTDAHGKYEIENFVGGPFVQIYTKVTGARRGDKVFLNQLYGGADCAIDTCPVTGAEPTTPTIADGVSSNVDFALDEGGEIAGHAIPTGRYSGPLDVYFELFTADGTFIDAFYSDHAGGFASNGLVPGNYYLVAHPTVASGLPCVVYAVTLCEPGVAPPSVGTPIVVQGTSHVSIDVGLFGDPVFADGFQ